MQAGSPGSVRAGCLVDVITLVTPGVVTSMTDKTLAHRDKLVKTKLLQIYSQLSLNGRLYRCHWLVGASRPGVMPWELDGSPCLLIPSFTSCRTTARIEREKMSFFVWMICHVCLWPWQYELRACRPSL